MREDTIAELSLWPEKAVEEVQDITAFKVGGCKPARTTEDASRTDLAGEQGYNGRVGAVRKDQGKP